MLATGFLRSPSRRHKQNLLKHCGPSLGILKLPPGHERIGNSSRYPLCNGLDLGLCGGFCG